MSKKENNENKKDNGNNEELGFSRRILTMLSKAPDVLPWRIALTIAAFAVPLAIPVVGPFLGLAVGTWAYGNYRSHNKKDNKEKKSEKPGFLKKLLFRAGTIAIGFALGGPIGAAVAIGFAIIEGTLFKGKISDKLIQQAEELLDVCYNSLGWLGSKILGGLTHAVKWMVNKVMGNEKEPEKAGPSKKENNLEQTLKSPTYSQEHEALQSASGVENKGLSSSTLKALKNILENGPENPAHHQEHGASQNASGIGNKRTSFLKTPDNNGTTYAERELAKSAAKVTGPAILG